MSPTAFKQQVGQLLAELAKCNELCNAIRENRRVGSVHQALDNLQSGFKDSASRIQVEYAASRKIIGSRMELGDETSRSFLSRAIRDVLSSIQPRLHDVAYRRRESHDPQLPGFRDLSRKLANIEADVLDALNDLARRIDAAKPEIPKPTTFKHAPKPQQQQPQPQQPRPQQKDDLIVSKKELDILVQHMKNSWHEVSVAGKILYVNAFDDQKSRWDRPEGFIKTLPRAPKPATRPTREHAGRQPPPPPRNDNWNRPDGW